MKNKNTIIYAIVGIIILMGVFYGGMTYGKSQIPLFGSNGFNQNGQNRTGQPGMGNRNGRMNGSGFVSGEILSKDANSVTVKINNIDPNSTNTQVGSKIILLGTSTEVTKTITGSLNDLATGTQIIVTGTANTDGSITAKTIQIRPQVKTSNF
ncbi:MAG: hypothetical protein WCS86_02260 [Candidatus Paceibacterota bacterium]